MSILSQLFFCRERARRYVSSLQKTMLWALLKGAVMLVGQQFISIFFLTGLLLDVNNRRSFACGAPIFDLGRTEATQIQQQRYNLASF